ncbi:phosphate ABC transporter permease [Haloarcula amylovorans]|uniref:phosphate ABC transporter permease n=1 Tax=Haloarcula amylovorans TaxID=2562280 RepID=UPI0010765CC6|nr:phosphate ABC transporter permease [Halomicroarcula amylolytica]
MSNETQRANPNGDSAFSPARVASALARERYRIVRVAGGVALAAVALRTLLHVLHNVPFDPVTLGSALRAGVTLGTSLVLSLALLVCALAATAASARVGLLFAGVFGPMAVLSDAATLPAVAAVTIGGGLALLGTLGAPDSRNDWLRWVVAAGLVAAVGISLGSSVGVVDGGVRALGTALTLGSLAVLPLGTAVDRTGAVAGGVGFATVAIVSGAKPYVVGSALVTGFAVVGVPHVLVALAVAGAVGAAVAGVRRDALSLSIGACLLLLAGVPATLPRAMAVLVGATLVVLGREAFEGAHSTGATTEGSA